MLKSALPRTQLSIAGDEVDGGPGGGADVSKMRVRLKKSEVQKSGRKIGDLVNALSQSGKDTPSVGGYEAKFLRNSGLFGLGRFFSRLTSTTKGLLIDLCG